jgi:PKD domain
MKIISKSGVVFVVTILFVSSSTTIMPILGQTSSYQEMRVENRGYFYAYNVYDPSGQTQSGPITFDTPDTIDLLAPGIFPNFCAAADINPNGDWYGCDYGGGLYQIDRDTGTQFYIAPTIGVNGMTYDSSTGIWYVTSSNVLYTMDVTTGTTIVVTYPQGGIGDIVCDLMGNMYGNRFNGSEEILCNINPNSGMVHEIGSTGLLAIYDLAYDRNEDSLYCVGYQQSGEPGFYNCDVDTGECAVNGVFEGGMEVDAVVIPFTIPSHFVAAHFSWTPSAPDPSEPILFDATACIALGGAIVLYEWDWDNDGTYDEESSSPTITHLWDSQGMYPVTLRATDNLGLSATKTHLVEIKGQNSPPPTPIISGPTTGFVNQECLFTVGPITDPEGDMFYCKWEWGDGTMTDWLGPYSSGQIITESHSWSHVGVYELRAKLKDVFDAESNWSTPHSLTIIENTPPRIPAIEGKEKGTACLTYLYVFVTTDPEQDDVWYYIDWGDTTNSGWLGPYPSGVSKSMGHSWNQQGTYLIKIKAKDIYDRESDWGTLSVTMPLEIPQFLFFEWLLERFPHASPLLRFILNY